MTTETTTASKKATEKAIAAVAAASETLPTVVETAEVALEIPSKVVLNQRLVVGVGVVAGIALGVGGVFGYGKLKEIRARRTAAKVVSNLDDELADKA